MKPSRQPGPAGGGAWSAPPGEAEPRSYTARNTGNRPPMCVLQVWGGVGCRVQDVAVAVHRADEARPVRIGLDLLSKSCDGVIDRSSRGWHVEIAPDLPQQLVPVNDAFV